MHESTFAGWNNHARVQGLITAFNCQVCPRPDLQCLGCVRCFQGTSSFSQEALHALWSLLLRLHAV
jgi:hypothetical protein